MCALRRLDSFDHYTTPAEKWTSTTGGSNLAAAARTGAQGLRFVVNSETRLTLDAQGTWIVGVAMRVSAMAAGMIIDTLDAGTVQGGVRLNADGTLSLLRGATVVATSTRSIQLNIFYYIELKHIIADAGGTLEVRVNEEVWATFAGDTKQTANATANSIRLLGPSGSNRDFDDLYILDGTGAAPNNDYWGDTHIEALVPDGPGTYQEWLTLVGAASHFQAVNEVPPNEDTSYIADAVLNARDTFALGALAVVSATINGIQTLMRVRKTDAGAASIARLLRTGALDFQGADVALATSYAYILEQIALNPNTGVAWSVAEINALEAGARVR